MAQVKGNGSTRQATIASKARNVSQNTENLYNAALVDWTFEDSSIPASKIVGGVTPAAHAPSHSDGGTDEITVENLATISVDTGQVLKPDGSGGLVFGAAGGGATLYDATHTTSLRSTNASVGALTAVALGSSASAGGLDSVAVGRNSNAGFDKAVAIGKHARAGANQAVVIGGGITANSTYVDTGATRAIAIGYYAQVRANALNSIALGYAATVRVGHTASIGIGKSVDIQGSNAIGIGANVNVNNDRENVIGEGITGGGANTFRLGISATQHFTFSSFTAAAGLLAVTHSLPIQVNGVTFNLLLNQ